MLQHRLAKAWEEYRTTAPVRAVMQFTDKGLVLGADTILAPAGRTPRDVRLDEPRLEALLTAAHQQRPGAAALAHLRKAVHHRLQGDDGLAAMHLALSGLSRLSQPKADAHRLFLADGLLKSGAPAAVVIAAIEAPAALRKYDQDQPRVPAGSGRPSGQWTSDGSGGSPAAAASPAAAPAAPQVNPSTVTPVAGRYVPGFPFHGEDACAVAIDECRAHAQTYDPEDEGQSHPDHDHIVPNLATRLAQCHNWAYECEEAEELVKNPESGVSGAIVSFPDGGLVVVKRGQTSVYYPPGWGGRRPPIWRGGRPLPRR